MSAFTRQQIWRYVLLLAIAALIFWQADQIAYTHRAGQLGPDVWPKAVAGLIAVICICQIIKAAMTQREPAGGATQSVNTGRAAVWRAFPKRLVGGIVLTLLYGMLVPLLGFLVASFVYLVAFFYIGGYRSHGVIWAVSAVATLTVALIFLKLVYVSLPRGAPPFDQLTDLVTGLF